ncbi:MAG TPA: hypothetical protein VG892_09010 [Terriglobales bacterium]|nr:hypothetical protein [Terriglobales bacterium]
MTPINTADRNLPTTPVESLRPAGSKRRGNPNWGKPEPFVMGASISSFESLVKSLKLSPDQYENSPALKEWVRANKDRKYVPQDLLQAWSFTVKSDI